MYTFIANWSYSPEFITEELLTSPILKTLTIGENLLSKSAVEIFQKSQVLSFYEGEKHKNFDLRIAEIANDHHCDFRCEDRQDVPNDVYGTRLPQWRKALPNRLRTQQMKSFLSKLHGTVCWWSAPMGERSDPREGRVQQPISLAFLGGGGKLEVSKIRKKDLRNRVSEVVVEALRELQRVSKKRSYNNNFPLKKDSIEPSSKPQKAGPPSTILQDDQSSKDDSKKPNISDKEGAMSRQKPLSSPSSKQSFVQDLIQKPSIFGVGYQRKGTKSRMRHATSDSEAVPKTGVRQTELALQPAKRQDLCTERTAVENLANVQNSTSKFSVLREEKRAEKCRYRFDDNNVEAHSFQPPPMKQHFAQTPIEENRLPEAATRRSTVRGWPWHSYWFNRQQKIDKSPQYPKKSKEQQAKCEMHGFPEWRLNFFPHCMYRVTVAHNVFKEGSWRYHF